MYYSLNKDYLLRGWEKLPCALMQHLGGKVIFLNPDFFSKIRDFPWMLFEGSLFLNEEEAKGLEQMKDMGIIELSDAMCTLTEKQAYRAYPNRFL